MAHIAERGPQTIDTFFKSEPQFAEGIGEKNVQGLTRANLRDNSSLARFEESIVDGVTAISKKYDQLSLTAKSGLALGALAITCGSFISLNNSKNVDRAEAITSDTVSYRPNGVAALPNGVRNIRFENVSSLIDLYAQYRTNYLFECTYDMSQNQFDAVTRANANKTNRNAILLKLIAHPNENFTLKNAVAKKIRNFQLTVASCTMPPIDVRYSKDLSGNGEMNDKVNQIKKLTGCTEPRVSPNYWSDIVRAINPEHYSPGGIVLPITDVIGAFHLGSGDKHYRFPMCRRFDTSRPQADQGIPSKYFIVIDDPFTPEDLYGQYALTRP